MDSEKNNFTEHLLSCVRDELITQLPTSSSSLNLLKEAQWIINNYLDHVISGIETSAKKTG